MICLQNTENEYTKDKKLKKEDVEALLTWTKKQQHLPEINEIQAIVFLQSCYYRTEAAKNAIDNFFTLKTSCPDLFKGRNPLAMKKTIDNSLSTILPKKTADGYTIIFLKLINTSPENFNFVEHIKYLDMVCMLEVLQNGTSEGHVIVADMKGSVFGHLTRAAMAGPTVLKNFLFYLQEAMPIRLKELHFVNIVPFMDKVLAMIKPFLKMEILDVLHLHNDVDSLVKFVPLECLPEDYGGSVESIEILHEEVKRQLAKNSDFFDWEDEQNLDETKRVNVKNEGNVFGLDGTFKKLELD